MTIHLEEIYDQYKKADLTDRINIYLQFPELRDEFLEIEQTAKKPFFFETATSQPKTPNRIKRWIRRSLSLLW